MRPKSLILLALALGCGLVASIGISQVMDKNGGPKATETVPIYVALHNINLGDPIEAGMLSLQEWPKDKVPRGVISKLTDIEGRRPRTAIIEGEPILEGKLLAQGQIADPIKAIPENMRLKTIAVDAEKSAAGLLGPGDRVDVQLFVKRNEREGIPSTRSKVILQNIRVFAVDQTVQRSPDGNEERTIAKTVSLMLTPEQASKLSLAEQVGEISLIPRNPDDQTITQTPEFTLDDIWADGDASNRKKEQGASDEKAEAEQPSTNSLVEAIRTTAPPVKPPFRMEIVEAQDIREVLFDGDTGKPIRNMVEDNGGPRVTPATPASYSSGASSDSEDAAAEASSAASDAARALDDFPIDLGGSK
jgi:pilus assembly protein CpaB